MNESISKCLSNVNKLIKEKQFNEALCICEEILKRDENNINALLMATKCWMDMNLNHNLAKDALEKVLFLKPKHPDATKGLRKFYEMNFLIYFDDAINFYLQLSKSNELSEKDISIITTDLLKMNLSKNAEDLVYGCLIKEIKDNSNEESLLTFCRLSIEKYIIFKEDIMLNTLIELLAHMDCNDPSETLVFVQNMSTFINAVIEKKDPVLILSIKTELNIEHSYAYILLGRVLCDYYMMSDCEDIITMGLERLQRDKTYNSQALVNVIINIRIENLIHLGDVNELEKHWLEVDESVISTYLWCQAYAVGYNRLSDGIKQWSEFIDTSCDDLSVYQRLLCRAITGGTSTCDISDIHQTFTEATLTSFEWYLWAEFLQSVNMPSDAFKALEFAVSKPRIYFKVYLKLAESVNKKKDYTMAVSYLECAVESHLSLETASAFVDLHLQWGKYEEPLVLLKEIEPEFFSTELLLKFIECLSKLDRVSDAICLALMVVKRSPSDAGYFQLLGDLYLRRDNINQAYKTYCRCVSLIGESADNCARLANVWSLTYQKTTDENDFLKSWSYFNRSLELGHCVEAIEGKTMVVFLHAQVSLKRLMLSAVISDINEVIALISEHAEILKASNFHMNVLGKIIILSVMGCVDKMIDVTPIMRCYFPEAMDDDCCDLALRCLGTSIEDHNAVSDSHYNCGLVELFRLNRKYAADQRGQCVDCGLYSKVEGHFKKALSHNPKCADAWKYLGYLYMRHGMKTEKLAFEIQHCLTMAIEISSDVDRINDPEAAFYLGLLYIKENWLDSAREIFKKIQMDYPVDAIGSVGMYLLADRDHTVEEQPEIARALMTYVYRDEDTSVNESCYQLNSVLVSLFAKNMASLVHHNNGQVIFNGNTDPTTLILALRTALSSAWTKYLAYSTIDCVPGESFEKKYKEYGCFLGIMELLIGDYRLGKRLLKRSTKNCTSDTSITLRHYLDLDKGWPSVGVLDTVSSLAKSLNVKLTDCGHPSSGKSSSTGKQFDEMLTSVILDNLSPSRSHSFMDSYVETLIGSIPSLCDHHASLDDQVSALLALGSFLVGLGQQQAACSYLATVETYCPGLVASDERLQRVCSRVQVLAIGDVSDVMRSLYDLCGRQPLEMDRWLTYLEFGLEYRGHGTMDERRFSVETLFRVTSRPWSMSPAHWHRYCSILWQHRDKVTEPALAHHRHMFLTGLRLFPDMCVPLMGLIMTTRDQSCVTDHA